MIDHIDEVEVEPQALEKPVDERGRGDQTEPQLGSEQRATDGVVQIQSVGEPGQREDDD